MLNNIDTFIFVKITRSPPALCMISVHKNEFVEKKHNNYNTPRIQDKLYIPLGRDPKIWDFNDRAHKVIRYFLHHQAGTLCFLALNGIAFDFPVLSAHFFKPLSRTKVVRQLRSHYRFIRPLSSAMCGDLTDLIDVGCDLTPLSPYKQCEVSLQAFSKNFHQLPLEELLSLKSLRAIESYPSRLKVLHKQNMEPTLVFLDIEYSGNPVSKIMEICFVVFAKHEVTTSETPEPYASLVLVLDPGDKINPIVSRMTKLNNKCINRSKKQTFSEHTAILMNYFLKHCVFSSQSKGVIVAHGGMNSDFPVLMRYLKDEFPIKGSDNLMCNDTLHGIRALDKENGLERPSCKLPKLYASLCSNATKLPRHNAESDVNMLIQVVNAYPGALADWLFENSCSFMGSNHRQVTGKFMKSLASLP